MTDEEILAMLSAVDLDAMRRLIETLKSLIPILAADVTRDVRRCANYERIGDIKEAWSVARFWIDALSPNDGSRA